MPPQAAETVRAAPGDGLDPATMPGHWLLARMGKRVLRPGGRELSAWLIDRMAIGPDDDVVEVAPGLGVTADMALARRPRSYVGIERDERAAEGLRRRIAGPDRRIIRGSAETIDLPDGAASAGWGEAVLTMCTPPQRERILRELHRVLTPGARLGMHELMLVPDDLPAARRDAILADLSAAIRVGARPLTRAEWAALLSSCGFTAEAGETRPMALLSPARVIRDEGPGRTLRILGNVLRDPVARRRVRAMRTVFHRHREHLAALAVVARRDDARP
ncbi:MAG: methyltransferase domain-containing protein [Thermoleophilia bacterium]|nr:methyltransferase domain-containing protein [Thermoleophilia bacterium]